MTREELIQSPEYWRTLYENECERLGIKPILTFLSPIDEEELNKLACDDIFNVLNQDYFDGKVSFNKLKEIYKACYRKILEGIV